MLLRRIGIALVLEDFKRAMQTLAEGSREDDLVSGRSRVPDVARATGRIQKASVDELEVGLIG